MKFVPRILIILFFLPVVVTADRIIVKNGSSYDGAILKSENNMVYLQTSDTIYSRIPSSLISSILFRYADIVYLLNGEEIKCKVLTRTISDLNIITESGARTIKIVDLKRFFYNDIDSLLVKNLPPTGDVFNNEKTLSLLDTRMDKTIFLGVAGGVIYPNGKAWQDNFITATSLLGLFAQGQIGITFVRNIAFYGGYLYGQFGNTTENNLESDVNIAYFHLGADYLHTFDFLPGVNFILGGDVGLVNLSGNIYTYSYRNIDIGGITPNIGFRLSIGARLFFMKQMAGSLKLGYFKVQDFNVPVPAEIEYNVTIPVSGWTVIAGVSFHMPI
jgi:hypothetical protein